jgi:hypothetical protein
MTPNTYMNLTLDIWWENDTKGVHFGINADNISAEKCLVDEYIADYEGWHQIELQTFEWDAKDRDVQLLSIIRKYLGDRLVSGKVPFDGEVAVRVPCEPLDPELQQLLKEREALENRILDARIRALPAMQNTHCDSCGADSPPGFRYACTTCSNYDICQQCNEKGIHSEHAMVQIRYGGQYVGKAGILMVVRP